MMLNEHRNIRNIENCVTSYVLYRNESVHADPFGVLHSDNGSSAMIFPNSSFLGVLQIGTINVSNCVLREDV